ncbi:hypothetical protein FGO68_gene4704 [Halteria grandinella]|uniref:Uncharacterized protein n=1 Tax=Halteria grandinella TaxID=5974 RepID=A0A8J8NW42_HALGN|nr:hypothetical protein FGO68_gene4704 [Halteria grandinella]
MIIILTLLPLLTLGQQPTASDFEIPSRVRTTVYYADLTENDSPIQTQLQGKKASIAYAWDFDANSYSELWRPTRDAISSYFTQSGLNFVSYANGRCSKGTDKNTKWSQVLENKLRARFTVKENGEAFGEPFQPDIFTNEKYLIWRTEDRKAWLWVRKANNQIAYIQEYRSDVKKVFVYWFPTGLTSESSNLKYEFYNFKCPNKY